MMDKGLIHIYTGEGKGKTTAALGLSLRACGRGRHVLWTSFLKDYDSGEFMLPPPFEVHRGEPVRKFFFAMSEEEKAQVRAEHNARARELFRRAAAEGVDLLVLDEAFGAISVGALDAELLAELLQARPQKLEVVMTGRGADGRLVEMADYITEMRPLRHPFDSGVPAREGVEF
ncbi:MAG: cob(I)yrinic acid a,c-diamide adenosyltransferase [Clostridia bacterium]|nr:cob(I)yrinic acid a,c-diamide adenosyltransferase [Clostridia bacterium]